MSLVITDTDRVASSHFKATQEQIANFLGVRREGVRLRPGGCSTGGAIRIAMGKLVWTGASRGAVLRMLLGREMKVMVCCR